MLNVRFDEVKPGIVRLRWWYGPAEGPRMEHRADFDDDPIRGLSAMESAIEWARRVLGYTG